MTWQSPVPIAATPLPLKPSIEITIRWGYNHRLRVCSLGLSHCKATPPITTCIDRFASSVYILGTEQPICGVWETGLLADKSFMRVAARPHWGTREVAGVLASCNVRAVFGRLNG
jgi:hypothetical protein